MNNKILYSFLTFVTVTLVIACAGGGGSGTGVAGIGGSGFVASGSVSGFGSVFVNGVEYNTDSASFDIDGVAGTQSDLGIGMRVTVNGSVNSDGKTGIANGISYNSDLMGPITGITPPDPNVNDGETLTFTTLGITVEANIFDTVFTVKPALQGTTFDYTTLAVNNHVLINGFFDTAGILHATRIELRNPVFDIVNSKIRAKGSVSTINNLQFSLTTDNNSVIQVDATNADTNDLPGGLVDGEYIIVFGSLTASNGIKAERLREVTRNLTNTDKISIEGLVSDFTNTGNNFKVSGFSVSTSSSTQFEPLTLTLDNDIRVEVEGPVVNGVLQANKVELRNGNTKVHATVSEIAPDGTSFKVEPVSGSGQTITVTVTATTQLDDNEQNIDPFTLSDLSVNNFVRIRGYENSNGGITATKVTRRKADDVIIEGTLTAGDASSATISVLGIDFDISTAKFSDIDNSSIKTQADFFAPGKAVVGTSIVKIRDRASNSGGSTLPPDGFADDIELQK